MKTSTLQSLIARGSSQILALELLVAREKHMISNHKSAGIHKDFYEYRYKRLSKFRRDLKALVKIQKSLKQEINMQHGSDDFFRKVVDSLPNHV